MEDYNKIPSGYHLIGNVALLRLSDDLQRYAHAIGKITMEYDKRIKSVAVRTSGTTGVERTPHYEVVAGSFDTETVHLENGVLYYLDPLRLTFSGGNVAERIRMAKVVREGERVVDMFACVGQFALPMARTGAQVVAIEINPVAYQYLVKNVRVNRLEHRVSTILGNSREAHPIKSADRIVMGYLHDTVNYLPAAVDILVSEGGFIHMHQAIHAGARDELMRTIEDTCRAAGYNTNITIRRVKMYSRCIEHMVFDIALER